MFECATKVTSEFKEKFSIPVLHEAVRRVLRAAGLNVRSAHRKFLLERKIESLNFHSQKQ